VDSLLLNGKAEPRFGHEGDRIPEWGTSARGVLRPNLNDWRLGYAEGWIGNFRGLFGLGTARL